MSYKTKTSLKAIVGFILLCAVAFIVTWMGLSIAHKTNPIDEIKSWGQQENEQIEEDKEPTEEDSESELQNVEDIENYSDLTIVA